MSMRTVSILITFFLFFLLIPMMLFPDSSSEFLVNTYTQGWQVDPSIGIDNSGKFVIAWQSIGQDGSYWGVFAQRFDSDGTPIGSEFQVNTYTDDAQEWVSAAVAISDAGNFVITWMSYGQDGSGYGIFARLYDGNGDPMGSEFQVNTYTDEDQVRPSAAMDSEGNFIITWYGKGTDDDFGIYAKRFDSDGNPLDDEFQVNTYTTGNQFFPFVAMNGAGYFVITWWGTASQDYSGVYARRYDAGGNPFGGEFLVNTYTDGVQNGPTIDINNSGNFVITWVSYGQDGSGGGVYAQRFDNNGSPQGDEFQVNTYTDDDQGGPYNQQEVALKEDDSFIITWQSYGQDGSGWGVYARKFDENGNPDGGEIKINNYTNSHQWYPAIAMNTSGFHVIAWHSWNQYSSNSAYDIYARINPAGTEQDEDAITLESFTARAETEGVILEWRTGTEIDNLGFYIIRSESTDDGYTLLNDRIIPAKGNAYSGNSYTLLDGDVQSGHLYYYWLADMDVFGKYTIHGPAKAIFGQSSIRPSTEITKKPM